MKTLILALALLSLNAFAGEAYTCTQLDVVGGPGLTLTLTQIGDSEIREGRPYRFHLVLAAPGAVILDEVATVQTEDVMFSFRVKSKPIKGMIYLDELDQTWLTIKGQRMDFDCNDATVIGR